MRRVWVTPLISATISSSLNASISRDTTTALELFRLRRAFTVTGINVDKCVDLAKTFRSCRAKMMCGAPSASQPADEEVQTLIETVREQSEEKYGKPYEQYKAVEFKSQVVAGTNYFVKVREQSEEKYGKPYEQYKAVEYKSQVVAGTNFFVKIQISDSEFIHVRIFKCLPHENGLPKLVGQQVSKTKEDPVEYF
ncbi:hypothetical protein EGW08_006073 [Elysia chlorotica]|uniref:Cystatin domain-containing protein n=1 Tax=Elysia chlorotica TaxID=188477 RepID=A0A3S0ZYH0_ELYCH|nr:hypothetical protein EGW08_006073 [Elysia chlorotica]